ncbi:hypothetical protein MMC10_008437 [Thelotrema lepadinum]|nr:hypothetical protein [Thelotrema lepadinum]
MPMNFTLNGDLIGTNLNATVYTDASCSQNPQVISFEAARMMQNLNAPSRSIQLSAALSPGNYMHFTVPGWARGPYLDWGNHQATGLITYNLGTWYSNCSTRVATLASGDQFDGASNETACLSINNGSQLFTCIGLFVDGYESYPVPPSMFNCSFPGYNQSDYCAHLDGWYDDPKKLIGTSNP